ncbi:hypothetical protein E2562_008970 [Oryza meyeriana var. granulata]|uniref:Uncharacterized protein n=1 Tax=Oryza meyeriana var. granulata TaxID=110450 RepID=A0A6G1D0V3_9ORYZ|nr:hypothetical protein E2562_008970 [Oryza meyeriana var. granulata]
MDSHDRPGQVVDGRFGAESLGCIPVAVRKVGALRGERSSVATRAGGLGPLSRTPPPRNVTNVRAAWVRWARSTEEAGG